jgi:hypothetical protein
MGGMGGMGGMGMGKGAGKSRRIPRFHSFQHYECVKNAIIYINLPCKRM